VEHGEPDAGVDAALRVAADALATPPSGDDAR